MKRGLIATGLVALCGLTGHAQTSVTTQHNDISRTGANPNETILTPANVNINGFGKLFSYPVDGYIYAQPLYMAGLTMGAGTAQAGTTHNVVFVATQHDTVYAFDADSNLGANANPLWQVSLIGAGEKTVPNADVSCADIIPEIGITSTPVIDPTTNTIYIVAKTTVNDTTFYFRLHALDITTGQEKFGGPQTLVASVLGTGTGSSGGTLTWDPRWQNNRAGLLLLNGILYISTGSHCDNGPWHGWILAYNAATLLQTGAWSSSPNSLGSGIWGGGSGLAADVLSGEPYGRIFVATGNGTFDAVAPYTNGMDYGDSILKLDLNNGVPTMNANGTVVGDDFTPHAQATLNNGDQDQGSGGTLLLPNDELAQVGKSGIVYVLNRENLGGYNPNNTQDPGEAANVGGVWGAPAYWNGNVYVWGQADHLKAFSYTNGVLSSNPTSTSAETAGDMNTHTYSPTPSVSANGTTNGIVWSLKTDNEATQGREVLYAHDASNVANLLYSSGSAGTETNYNRDNPGNSVKFIVPTVVNGKVYVGSQSRLSVFGLLNGATQAATPAISPSSQSFNSSIQVTISDATTNASIYYTTNGTAPTTASTKYSGPFTVTTTTTVNAMAAGTGLLQSAVASAAYTLTTQVATPNFTPVPATYVSAQLVTISTTTANATLYYTTDGSKPTTSSLIYTGPVSIGATETLSAVAVASGLSNSPVASGVYTIIPEGVSSINFASGFASGGMNLLGSAALNGSSLQLTNGGSNEAAAAWYQLAANIQAFTTDFTFQVTPGTTPEADGFAFVIQGNNTTALGPLGGGLGYGPDTPGGTGGIPSSVAVKFDLYSNQGEGSDSTGLYTNGASPTTPAVDMTPSGVDLNSGDPFHVHMTYDGTTLAMTITDTVTNASFPTSWPVDIPSIVGDSAGFIGFTAGTGGYTAVQSIQTWTFTQLAPMIASLSTTSGMAGTPVTITGTNFGATQGTNTVTFNGTPATVTSWSPTSIATSVPSAATSGSVVVTVGEVASNGVGFTVTGLVPLLGISPTSVTFPSQYVGSSAPSQSITLTNSGNAALAITNMSVSVSDFSVQNTCGSSIAPGANCSIGLSFAPTVGGARTGTLTITDNAANSPQTVALSGVGQDFSIATTSPSSVTVAAGQTATYTFAVTPVGGFNQTVALTCSGAATPSVCNVSPNAVSLNGTSSTPFTVSIATAAATAASKGILPPFRIGPSGTKYEPLALTGLAVGFIAVISVLLWCPKQRFPHAQAIAITVALALTMLMSSCGGGHTSTTPGLSPGTPAGTYTISISASFTSGSTALTHNTSLTLVVQ